MDNNDELTLSKELSSYSSFFKTQTSITNDPGKTNDKDGNIPNGSTIGHTKDVTDTKLRHSSPLEDRNTVQNTAEDAKPGQLKPQNGDKEKDNVLGLDKHPENALQNKESIDPNFVSTNKQENKQEERENKTQPMSKDENIRTEIPVEHARANPITENNFSKDEENIVAMDIARQMQTDESNSKATDTSIVEKEHNNSENDAKRTDTLDIVQTIQKQDSGHETPNTTKLEKDTINSAKDYENSDALESDRNLLKKEPSLNPTDIAAQEQERNDSAKDIEKGENLDKPIQPISDGNIPENNDISKTESLKQSRNTSDIINSEVFRQEELKQHDENRSNKDAENRENCHPEDTNLDINKTDGQSSKSSDVTVTSKESKQEDNDFGNTKSLTQSSKVIDKKSDVPPHPEVKQNDENTEATAKDINQSSREAENRENCHPEDTKRVINLPDDQLNKPVDASETSEEMKQDEQSIGAFRHESKSTDELNLTNPDDINKASKHTQEPRKPMESTDLFTSNTDTAENKRSDDIDGTITHMKRIVQSENKVNQENNNNKTSNTITIPQCEIVNDNDDSVMDEDQMPTTAHIENETVFITGITSPNYAVQSTDQPIQAENNTLNTSDTNVPLQRDIGGELNDSERQDSSTALNKRNPSEIDNGNIFFTGRLPTIVNMNEKSDQMHTNDRDFNEEYLSKHSNLNQNESSKEPTDGSGQTADTEVKRLLEKMKEPIEPRDAYSRGNHLTPGRMYQKGKSVISARTAKTEVIDETDDDDRDSDSNKQLENTAMTVGDINMYTNKVIRKSNSEDQESKFDDLKHMKNISEYVQQNIENGSKKWEHDEEDVEFRLAHDTTHRQIEDYDTQLKPNNFPGETDSTVGEKRNNNLSPINCPSKLAVDIQNTGADTSHDQSDISSSPNSREVTGIRRFTSENDLKAIIASAKMAYGDTTDESDICNKDLGFSERANVSMVGESKPIASKPRSFGNRYVGESTPNRNDDHDETLSSLICSSCLQVDRNIQKSGFCTSCQTYLCNTCITVHLMDGATKMHHISPSYCKNDVHKDKYVHATGYCADCNRFLCSKCTIQHSQLRANRRHKIIQSSFVSKQTERQKESNDFLNELQDKLNNRSSEASSIDGTEKKRRRLLTDLKTTNPYRYRFGNVSESVYPGSKKKLATTYTKRPKWPHSSLPALPYLVQPKFIKEKFTYPKHLGFSSNKKEIAYMSAKLKTLQARYNVLPEYEKLYSRKETMKFKKTVGHPIEGVSLPDIDNNKGNQRTVRTVPLVNKRSKSNIGLRQSDFIGEYHLTLPIATCEKPTEIIAMTTLANGNLAVIDKNNNNIKIYNKSLACKAALQFHNRLVDITSSNICPTDVYVAIPKHVYEVSNEHGLEVKRKMKVEIKRIEGLTYWKYGIAVISKQSNITWELRLLDYRGNQKSKLEIFNPLTCDIASSTLCHVTTSKGGKRISISDSKNFCIITVDVTSRDVQHETSFGTEVVPTYLTSDGDDHNNIYVSANDKVYQISRTGKVKGVIIDKSKDNGRVGSIVCNKANDRLYVQTGKDRVAVYQLV